VIELPSAASFMNIQSLIGIVKKHEIDAVHPGYGFLSESEDFSKRMWEEAGAVVVGPGWGILANTGDKLKARLLAEECKYIRDVPGVLCVLTTPSKATFPYRQHCRHRPTALRMSDGSLPRSATPSW